MALVVSSPRAPSKHGRKRPRLGAAASVNGRVLLTNDAVALEVLSEPLGAPRWKQLYAGRR
jgi:hypothetical protein